MSQMQKVFRVRMFCGICIHFDSGFPLSYAQEEKIEDMEATLQDQETMGKLNKWRLLRVMGWCCPAKNG
jgi:chromosome condensin MukBEF complex kleisin-like MukF subunit